MALLKNGKLDEAIGNFREAIRIREHPRAHAGLAMALVQKGKTSEAFSNWQRCLQLQPDDVIVRKNFASALIDAGRPFEAMAQWEACLKYEPDDVGAQTYLAWALSTAPDAFTRDGTRAVQLGERALQLSFVPRIPIFRALAAAYAETGQFSMAIRVATRGLELAMAQKNFAMADDLRKDISLFESNTPLRDSRLGDSATSP
jgi:tetratricopeptide (TPR) repeat protein